MTSSGNLKSEAPKVRLGELIEIFEKKNSSGQNYPFYGVNKDKTFMPTVADTNELDNTKYKIVRGNMFVYSGMQTGRDVCIRLALYGKEKTVLISPAYTTFVVRKSAELLPEYLYMFFKRFEMDRYGAFLSDSSIRSNLDWDRFCEIEIPLPDIQVQRDLVAIYGGLQKIVAENEALIAQLESVCHDFVVDCKSKYPKVKLGDYIQEIKEKNTEGRYNQVLGLSTLKQFREANARVNKSELNSYKIVYRNNFAFVPTTDTWKVFACALNRGDTIVVSPIYCVFAITDPNLLPEYLSLIYHSNEFDRYVRFNSWESARENFNYSDLCNVNIPLPPIDVQKSIVSIYNCLTEAKRIVADARELMKNICPALVQKAAHSA